MNHDIVLSYINALGFPVCVSIAMGFALWKLGSRLADAHFDLVISLKTDSAKNADNIKNISHVVSKWGDPSTICREQAKPARNH